MATQEKIKKGLWRLIFLLALQKAGDYRDIHITGTIISYTQINLN